MLKGDKNMPVFENMENLTGERMENEINEYLEMDLEEIKDHLKIIDDLANGFSEQNREEMKTKISLFIEDIKETIKIVENYLSGQALNLSEVKSFGEKMDCLKSRLDEIDDYLAGTVKEARDNQTRTKIHGRSLLIETGLACLKENLEKLKIDSELENEIKSE